VGILFIVSYIISKKESKEEFLIAGRNRGSVQILFSKFATVIGAGFFITYTGFAYEYGFGIFAMLFGMFAGYLLFGLWAAPKIYKNSKKNKFYTMGDFVYNKTKNKFSLKITNSLSNLILFVWMIVGIIGGAKIINNFELISYPLAVILITSIVLIYIYLAGFKAVLITDFIQAIIILGLLFLITFDIIHSGNFLQIFSAHASSVDIGAAIGFFLFGLLSIFSYSFMFQLCYSAKDEIKLKRGIVLSIIPVLIVASFLLLIGIFMSSKTTQLDSGLIFVYAMKNFLSPQLLPLGIILFFAGIMSSIDTSVYAISSHLVLNKKIKIKNIIKLIRQKMILLMIVSALIALAFTDIVDVSIIAAGLSLVLSLPIIYLISNGQNYKKFVSSIIGGLIGLIFGIIVFGINPLIILPILLFSTLGLFYNFNIKFKFP